MPRSRSSSKKNSTTANLGFEHKLWLAADKLRKRSGQNKPARGKRRFVLAKRARRVRLMGNQPKQSNATTRRLAMMNLAIDNFDVRTSNFEFGSAFRRDRSNYECRTANFELN